MTTYSVLMSVYFKEKPDFLKQSMCSIWKQSAQTNDFVLVCDGPLGEELNAVIQDMQKLFGDVLHVVRLAENGGLGHALNEGMKYCKNDLIARMDSDDIAYPDRCERQLKIFEKFPSVSISSGIVQEFTQSTAYIDTKRIPPETQEEILLFAKKRNPFNHPCVMYRKSAVQAAGGYQDFYLLEDYYLWIRMLMNGVIGYNLQEPILWMRAGRDMYKRRAGWRYAQSQRKLFAFMYHNNFITFSMYVMSSAVRGISSMLPNCIRQTLFLKLLRKSV